MPSLSRRQWAIVGLALALPLVAASLFSKHLDDEPEWPYSVSETAEEVSLSHIETLTQTPLQGRRAGVLGRYIYVETPVSDLPGPDDGTRDFNLIASYEDADTQTVRAQLPYPADDMIANLVSHGDVPLRIYENPGYEVTWADRFFQLLPIFIILAIILLIFSRGATKGLGLSSSFEVIEKHKLAGGFDTVAGIDTAREEIQEIVDFLKSPRDASRLGGRMPKGAIFSGPPGTGKTLLARAMAKEAGVPFLSIEASGVNQLFVGAGAMKIKRAFREARKRAPCIVFIDEIDAMGRARGTSNSGAGDEKETTLNALLVELDGFDGRDGVVVIAATNRPEILDPALTRRGRIDRHIHIDLPDMLGRKQILEVHTRHIEIDPTLDLTAIAATTPGFSGADLAALVNEAALLGAREHNKTLVDLADFNDARDRLLIGLSGSRRILSAEDRRLTAIHEAGHAMIAGASPDADTIEKATILPQGGALGYVMQNPDEDRSFETRARLLARIRVAVAGRVAEEIVFGPNGATSGAASDVRVATRIARDMVARFGMTQSGFVLVDPNDPLLHDPNGNTLEHIRQIISAEMDVVRAYLRDNLNILERIADALEVHETLSGKDIHDILGDLRGSLPIDSST